MKPRFYDVRTVAVLAADWRNRNPDKAMHQWFPERPKERSTVPRWQLAWWVLTGQADVLLWPDFGNRSPQTERT
jgi:hypothetical protein